MNNVNGYFNTGSLSLVYIYIVNYYYRTVILSVISIVYGIWYFLLRKAPHQPKPTLTASSGFNLLPILFSVNISLTIYYTALTLLAPPTDSIHSNSSIFIPFNPS